MNEEERKKVLKQLSVRAKESASRSKSTAIRTLDEITKNVDASTEFLTDVIDIVETEGKFDAYGFSHMDEIAYFNKLFELYGLDVAIPTDNKTRCGNMCNAISNSFNEVSKKHMSGRNVVFGFRNNPKNYKPGFYGKFYSNKKKIQKKLSKKGD